MPEVEESVFNEPVLDEHVEIKPRRVLVAGATGYIGRRLVSELVGQGHSVRCIARTPSKLDAEIWRGQVEVITGDVLDPTSLVDAFNGMEMRVLPSALNRSRCRLGAARQKCSREL